MKRILFFLAMLISLAGNAQNTVPATSLDDTRQPAIRINENSIDTGALIIRTISPVNTSATKQKGPLQFKWKLEGYRENNPEATYTLVVYKFTAADKPEEILQGKPFYKAEGLTETSHLSKVSFDDASAIYAYRLELINHKGESIANSQLTIFYGGIVLPFPFNFCILICNPQTLSFCVPPSLVSVPVPVPFAFSIGSCLGTITCSINGGPYIPIPLSGNFPVTAFQAGDNILTFKLTCNCHYPAQSCTYHVNIFPQITATPDRSELCRGEGAKLSIAPFPLPAGYEVSWDWSDNNITWNSLGSGNGKNTNPILPACAAGVSFVTRYFRPTITSLPGLTPWPAGCVQAASIKVWCPTQAGTITASPTPGYCSNNQTFTLNYTGGTGHIVDWTENGNSLNTTATSITRTKAPGDYTYEVIVKNGTCASSIASLIIHVEAPLTAVITGNTTEVCPNGAAVLQLTSAVPQGATIKWEYQVECAGPWINSGVTGTVQNSNNIGNAGPYSPAPLTKLCWRATVSSASGICPPVTSNTWSINIIQAPCVPVITTTSTLPKCPGSSVTLTASTSCGTGPFTYKWYLDGIYVGSGATWNAVMPGDYTVEVFNKNNCESRLSKKFTVTDCINIITITGPCNVLPSTPIKLCATVASQPGTAPCGTGFTYLWSSPSGPGSTATQSCNKWNPAPTASTTYTVLVTNSIGCATTASFTVKICQ